MICLSKAVVSPNTATAALSRELTDAPELSNYLTVLFSMRVQWSAMFTKTLPAANRYAKPSAAILSVSVCFSPRG